MKNPRALLASPPKSVYPRAMEPLRLQIDLDERSATHLALMLAALRANGEDWTPAELLASLVAHLLEDDFAACTTGTQH